MGVVRPIALAEREIPDEFDDEHVRVLVAELIQQILINSEGAHYLPQLLRFGKHRPERRARMILRRR